jgi:hypothetical protein
VLDEQLRLAKLLPMHSQERQAPKLTYIALSGSYGTKGDRLKFVSSVGPRPHLVTQLRSVSINRVPQAVVCRENLAVQFRIGAKV